MKTHHVEHTTTLTLHAPPEQVFPLFGPVREAEWAEGWSPQIIYAESPLAEEEGAVFATRHDDHTDTIWIVTHYDPAAFRIEYARTTPGITATRVLVRCDPAPNGHTTAHVTYQITSLSGDDISSTHDPHHVSQWADAINHALFHDGSSSTISA